MRATSIHQIGNIVDSQNNILLKMWSASVSTGKRPINPNFCFNHNKSFRNRIESENVGCLSTLFDTVKEKLSSQSTE